MCIHLHHLSHSARPDMDGNQGTCSRVASRVVYRQDFLFGNKMSSGIALRMDSSLYFSAVIILAEECLWMIAILFHLPLHHQTCNRSFLRRESRLSCTINSARTSPGWTQTFASFAETPHCDAVDHEQSPYLIHPPEHVGCPQRLCALSVTECHHQSGCDADGSESKDLDSSHHISVEQYAALSAVELANQCELNVHRRIAGL
jgi:hypothetical protein